MPSTKKRKAESQEVEKASDLAETAADQLFKLANHYKEGTGGVTKDEKKSWTYTTWAAELGHAEAQYLVGADHASKGEPTEAVKWYKLAAGAMQLNKKAQYSLGLAYELGNGIGQSHDEAYKCFQASAYQEYPPAQFKVGVCFANGHGVERDEKKAADFYQSAVNQKYPRAQNNLGYFYELAKGGLERNIDKAIELYKLAATHSPTARANLGVCYQIYKKDNKLAFKYYKQAAEDIPFAKVKLAICHELGFGTPQDSAKATELFNNVKASGYNPLDDLPPESHEVSTKKPKFRFFEQSEVALIKEHFKVSIKAEKKETPIKQEGGYKPGFAYSGSSSSSSLVTSEKPRTSSKSKNGKKGVKL